MMISNVDPTPRVWTDADLAKEAQKALDEFVDRRLAEPGGKYLAHVRARRAAIFELFKKLSGVDVLAPDADIVRSIMANDVLYDALRYVAGPPVSQDDLGVLVTRRVEGITKEYLKDDGRVVEVLNLICKLADPFRFPWIAAKRLPSKSEIRAAVATTMILHATQSLQTERRGHGRVIEQRFEKRLIALGFVKVAGLKTKQQKAAAVAASQPMLPARGKITQPSHHPSYPHFYGECTVYGRKVDLFIALATGRMIALEAKDSSSAINSTKRLLNDTAAKAKHFGVEAGKNIINVALLSGVFAFDNLKEAQKSGLHLVWAHDIDGFIEWIKSQQL